MLCWDSASYLLLGQLDLVELLHVLLIVLLLQLTDEAHLLLRAVWVLLSSVLLELHRCLRIQCCHYLLSGYSKMNENGNTGKQQEVRQIYSEIFIFGPSVSTGLTLVFCLTINVEIKSDLEKKPIDINTKGEGCLYIK